MTEAIKCFGIPLFSSSLLQACSAEQTTNPKPFDYNAWLTPEYQQRRSELINKTKTHHKGLDTHPLMKLTAQQIGLSPSISTLDISHLFEKPEHLDEFFVFVIDTLDYPSSGSSIPYQSNLGRNGAINIINLAKIRESASMYNLNFDDQLLNVLLHEDGQARYQLTESESEIISFELSPSTYITRPVDYVLHEINRLSGQKNNPGYDLMYNKYKESWGEGFSNQLDSLVKKYIETINAINSGSLSSNNIKNKCGFCSIVHQNGSKYLSADVLGIYHEIISWYDYEEYLNIMNKRRENFVSSIYPGEKLTPMAEVPLYPKE